MVTLSWLTFKGQATGCHVLSAQDTGMVSHNDLVHPTTSNCSEVLGKLKATADKDGSRVVFQDEIEENTRERGTGLITAF